MPKTKDEILSVLEIIEKGDAEAFAALEDKKDFIAGFNAIIKEANKNASNVKSLDAKVNELEALNKTMTNKFNKVSDFIGLSMQDSETVEAVEKSLKKIREEQAKDAEGKADTEKTIATLNANMQALKTQTSEQNRTIKDLSDKNAVLEKSMAAEVGKRKHMISQLAIRDALIANEAVSPEITARLFVDAVKVRDDDTTVYTDENGNEMDVNEGIRSFLEKNPYYRKNNQIAGAGGGGNISSGGNIDFENLDPAEYRRLRMEGKIK